MVEWDEDDTYAAGEWIYYQGSTTPLQGEAYQVVTATTAGQNPQDNPSLFQKFNFPYVLAETVKRGALADWLGAGGGGTALGDTQSSVGLASYNEKRALESLEDEAYKKAEGQLRLQLTDVFNPFNELGHQILIPGAIEEVIELAIDFSKRLRGEDHPIKLKTRRNVRRD